MRVYVAGSYKFRAQIDNLVLALSKVVPTLQVTSRWISQGEEEEMIAQHGHQRFINLDIEDIQNCDVFLLINVADISSHSQGKWIEFGMAMAQRKLVVVFGKHHDNLFIHDKCVVRVPSEDLDDLAVVLNSIQSALNLFHGTEDG